VWETYRNYLNIGFYGSGAGCLAILGWLTVAPLTGIHHSLVQKNIFRVAGVAFFIFYLLVFTRQTTVHQALAPFPEDCSEVGTKLSAFRCTILTKGLYNYDEEKATIPAEFQHLIDSCFTSEERGKIVQKELQNTEIAWFKYTAFSWLKLLQLTTVQDEQMLSLLKEVLDDLPTENEDIRLLIDHPPSTLQECKTYIRQQSKNPTPEPLKYLIDTIIDKMSAQSPSSLREINKREWLLAQFNNLHREDVKGLLLEAIKTENSTDNSLL
jgi:hypothetical protein